MKLRLDEYAQIKQAAAYLGVCRNTLRNWEKAGKLSSIRNPLNNYRLYRWDDLKNFLETMGGRH